MKSEIIHPEYYSFTMDSSKMNNYGYVLPFKVGTYTTANLGIFTIDWGDTTSTVITNNIITRALMIHSYTKNTGLYKIKITSSTYRFPEIYFDPNNLNDYYHTLKTIDTILPPLYLANGNRQTDFRYAFINCDTITSISADLFILNGQLTYFQGCFINCTSLTSIPNGLFRYNVDAYGFGRCFNGCTSLTSIPTDLFRYNTNVSTFAKCFQGCVNIISCPQYLFRYNVLATKFTNCFYGCTKLTLNTEIFCDSTTEKTTRFTGKTINFTYCFLLNSSFVGTQGTAPDLWNYTFGSVTSTSCFTGHSTSSLTNYNDIPSGWK